MASIEKDLRGYICDNSEKNWSREFLSRELSFHKVMPIIDHPDASITQSKLRDGSVCYSKLDKDVTDKFHEIELEIELVESALSSETAVRKAIDETKVGRDELSLLLKEKVSAVDGKGLSENDYTDEEKKKLSDLPKIKEGGILDATKYLGVEAKIFGVWNSGVQMNPKGFYTGKNDFSTIYTADEKTLQDELDIINGNIGDIDLALDSILAVQQSYIGGDEV